ncbi:efflux RND transporter permease subunit [Sorangium sp. So ce1099]
MACGRGCGARARQTGDELPGRGPRRAREHAGELPSRLGISQFPDVDFPTITIFASLEGAAPEIMEHDVVEPIEEAAVQVEGDVGRW